MTHPRLADPAEHFPYKAGRIAALIKENPPAGPQGPDDDRVRVRDLTSQAIADASRDYIEAQAAHLAKPTDDTKTAYDAAADELVVARQRHRNNRPSDVSVIGVRGAE